MGDKVKLGVRTSKFLTPDLYDVILGEIAADCAKIATFAEQGLPIEDQSILDDGSTDPNFDEASCYALEVLEQAADTLKRKAANARSMIAARPKAVSGPVRPAKLDRDDDDEDQDGGDDEDQEPVDAANLVDEA